MRPFRLRLRKTACQRSRPANHTGKSHTTRRPRQEKTRTRSCVLLESFFYVAAVARMLKYSWSIPVFHSAQLVWFRFANAKKMLTVSMRHRAEPILLSSGFGENFSVFHHLRRRQFGHVCPNVAPL